MQQKSNARKVRGYDMRVYRQGIEAPEKLHAWGEPGVLPADWEQIKTDPSIRRASIFYSSQRNRRADRRQYLDEFTREA